MQSSLDRLITGPKCLLKLFYTLWFFCFLFFCVKFPDSQVWFLLCSLCPGSERCPALVLTKMLKWEERAPHKCLASVGLQLFHQWVHTLECSQPTEVPHASDDTPVGLLKHKRAAWNYIGDAWNSRILVIKLKLRKRKMEVGQPVPPVSPHAHTLLLLPLRKAWVLWFIAGSKLDSQDLCC